MRCVAWRGQSTPLGTRKSLLWNAWQAQDAAKSLFLVGWNMFLNQGPQVPRRPPHFHVFSFDISKELLGQNGRIDVIASAPVTTLLSSYHHLLEAKLPDWTLPKPADIGKSWTKLMRTDCDLSIQTSADDRFCRASGEPRCQLLHSSLLVSSNNCRNFVFFQVSLHCFVKEKRDPGFLSEECQLYRHGFFVIHQKTRSHKEVADRGRLLVASTSPSVPSTEFFSPLTSLWVASNSLFVPSGYSTHVTWS